MSLIKWILTTVYVFRSVLFNFFIVKNSWGVIYDCNVFIVQANAFESNLFKKDFFSFQAQTEPDQCYKRLICDLVSIL